MSERNRKSFKKKLKRDELIALANESLDMEGESSLGVDDDEDDDIQGNEINSSQNEDEEIGKSLV